MATPILDSKKFTVEVCNQDILAIYCEWFCSSIFDCSDRGDRGKLWHRLSLKITDCLFAKRSQNIVTVERLREIPSATL